VNSTGIPAQAQRLDKMFKKYGFRSDDENTPNIVNFQPCLANYMTEYLNNEDVQVALGVADRNITWSSVSPVLRYGNESDIIAYLFPKFFEMAPDWRILVVSGDADSAVPFIDTQRWITCLNNPVVRDWYNWEIKGQIRGSAIIYENLSFATVKGCGHEINYYCPEAGYVYFERWINAQDF